MSYLTNNIATDCGFNHGGLKSIWLANWTNLIPYLGYTNIQRIRDISTFVNWENFALEENICSFKEEMNLNSKLIGRVYVHTLNLYFTQMSYQKRQVLDQLCKSNLLAIVKDMNDKYWLIGVDTPLKAVTFAQKTDILNGANDINLSFISNSKQTLKEISLTYTDLYVERNGYIAVDGFTEMIGNNEFVGFHLEDII